MMRKSRREHLNNEELVEATPLDIDKYYQYFRSEFERRKITEGSLGYDSVEDDESYEWLSYCYTAQDEHELDVSMQVSEFGIALFAGPLQLEIRSPELETEMHDHVMQLIDLIQMFLNGQFAIVVTYRDKDNSWQAAELVYTAKRDVEKTICVVPHYSYARSSLKATTLRNHLNYPTLSLDDNNLFQPIKINECELLGRHIDLLSPAPLTPKMYSTYNKDMIIRHLGGESGEALWELFYRRIDFWIVCFVVGAPAVWTISVTPDSFWWVSLLVGFVGVSLLMILTSFLLTRRQTLIDSGRMPFTERLEELINYRILSAFWALSLIAILFFAPIWTTHENPHTLQVAFQVPQLVSPLFISCFGIFAAMVLIKPSSRIQKIIRTATMTLGYGGVLFCNLVLLYGGEDAATPPGYFVYAITILPLTVLFWYFCDCFRGKRGLKGTVAESWRY